MRVLWKGAVSFGLVHIPIRLGPATVDRAVRFRQLHARDHTPIRYRKECPACGETVGDDEIVRGFEFSPGEFVVVRDEDLERLPLPTRRTIEVLDFVRQDEVDPIYYERPYRLEPAEGGERPYALLVRTLERTGKVGLSRLALRQRERLGLLRVYRGFLLLETLHRPEDLLAAEAGEARAQLPEPDPRELEVAEELVSRLSVPFDPSRYRDRYQAALRELVEQKVSGREIVLPAPVEEAPPQDLLAALRESVRRIEEGRALAGRTG
ncbi:MAG: Ku protein [Clostridia bacterium]|nr:Ku protein [Clostridia bacterium]